MILGSLIYTLRHCTGRSYYDNILERVPAWPEGGAELIQCIYKLRRGSPSARRRPLAQDAAPQAPHPRAVSTMALWARLLPSNACGFAADAK